MLDHKVECLTDSELLSVITESAIETRQFVEDNPDLYRAIANIGNLPCDERFQSGKFQRKLEACVEFSKRFQKGQMPKLQRLNSPAQVALYLLSEMQYLEKEQFVVLSLNLHNQLIGKNIISIGTKNFSLVSVREVFLPALRHNAAKIVVAHNHPSGNKEPSEEDEKLTIMLKKASSCMEIPLVDHIIIGNGDYYSFAEHKKMEGENNAEN